MENLITVSYDDKSLQINIPLDLLVFSQENRDEPFLITDVKEMAEWMVNNLVDFQVSVGQQETGATEFTDLLDNAFVEAYQDGETWILSEYDQDNE